jgi:hypothetical protein
MWDIGPGLSRSAWLRSRVLLTQHAEMIDDLPEGVLWVLPLRARRAVVPSIDPAIDAATRTCVAILQPNFEGPPIAAGDVVQPSHGGLVSYQVDLDIHCLLLSRRLTASLRLISAVVVSGSRTPGPPPGC